MDKSELNVLEVKDGWFVLTFKKSRTRSGTRSGTGSGSATGSAYCLLEAEAPEAEAEALRVEAEAEALKIVALPDPWL